ncbi:MAG: hypothetical protein LBF22_00570 [Deltaproteobacteria bacterium]|jgi:tetratricopeptide (TPR) repeat protein|nr:hypothetical protein [Deltaproteobacteria bacterium]
MLELLKKVQDPIFRGTKLIEAKKFAEARAHFLKFLSVTEFKGKTSFYLAILEAREKNGEKAEEYFKTSLECDPKFDLARVELTKLYLGQENFQEALKHAKILIENGNAFGFELAAFINRALGKWPETKALLKKAVELNPSRLDLARTLAGISDLGFVDPFPKIDPKNANHISLAEAYLKSFGDSLSTALQIQIAKSLSNMADPGAISENMLKVSQVPERTNTFLHQAPPKSDLKNLKIFFAPTPIAGVSPRIAKWFNSQGAIAKTCDYSPGFLKYDVDFLNEINTPTENKKFMQQSLSYALQTDVICLDFASSLLYVPYLTKTTSPEGMSLNPYRDLDVLKEKGKKIFFIFWGSDCYGQSFIHHNYLKFLGLDWIPKPPSQSRNQYFNIKFLSEYADGFVAPSYFSETLPATAANWDVCLEPEIWKAKEKYNSKISKILLAPTSGRKKNIDIIDSAIASIQKRYPEVMRYVITNKPHHEVPGLYALADLGIDQATMSFGLLSVEMMASGVPVIANYNMPRHGSIREQAPIIPFDNIHELYTRIEDAVKSPAALERLGKLGREYALTFHSNEYQGKILGRLISQAVSGEKPDQLISTTFDKNSEIWQKNPETVPAFKYFDISVPLFCALGKYNYAEEDCFEAIRNKYRHDKFVSFYRAIEKYTNPESYEAFSLKMLKNGNEDVCAQVHYYIELLTSSQKLLDEAVKAKTEYEKLVSIEEKLSKKANCS